MEASQILFWDVAVIDATFAKFKPEKNKYR